MAIKEALIFCKDIVFNENKFVSDLKTAVTIIRDDKDF